MTSYQCAIHGRVPWVGRGCARCAQIAERDAIRAESVARAAARSADLAVSGVRLALVVDGRVAYVEPSAQITRAEAPAKCREYAGHGAMGECIPDATWRIATAAECAAVDNRAATRATEAWAAFWSARFVAHCLGDTRRIVGTRYALPATGPGGVHDCATAAEEEVARAQYAPTGGNAAGSDGVREAIGIWADDDPGHWTGGGGRK